jgi:hypothetical protein
METLNFCKNVMAIRVTGNAFKDWDTYLEIFTIVSKSEPSRSHIYSECGTKKIR